MIKYDLMSVLQSFMLYRGTNADAGRLLTHWAAWSVWQSDVDPAAARETLQGHAGKKRKFNGKIEKEMNGKTGR